MTRSALVFIDAVMDEKKIFIVNLAKSVIGDDAPGGRGPGNHGFSRPCSSAAQTPSASLARVA
jgi:hypothetical protein